LRRVDVREEQVGVWQVRQLVKSYHSGGDAIEDQADHPLPVFNEIGYGGE